MVRINYVIKYGLIYELLNLSIYDFMNLRY
jgi:hypothetical protein